MPWKIGDVEKFNKGLKPASKQAWVDKANEVLASCLADGGEQDECEKAAIIQANRAVAEEVAESGALTFADLDVQRTIRQKIRSLEELVYDLIELMNNILYSDDVDDKPSALQMLATEFAQRVAGETQEAATIKSKLQRLARDLDSILADRSVPSKLRKEIEDVRAELKRTWDDLANDTEEPEDEAAPPEACICPDCGFTQDKELGVPCRSLKCPECGATMAGDVEPEPEEESLSVQKLAVPGIVHFFDRQPRARVM